MKRIGIIAKKGVPEAIEAVRALLKLLNKKEFRVFIEDEAASILGVKGYPRQQIPRKSDVIVVFGGDGTLLSVARLVGSKGIPILGVNLGGLGFITEIAKDEIRDRKLLERIFSGSCGFEERIVLSADVYRKGRRAAHSTALNDVVVNKSALARMVKLDISINNKHVTTFRADGLIISTPTGSTAHSLSAGGPILYPTLGSFVVTPICPHTLTNRPIVLPDEFVLDVNIMDGKGVHLTLDGQVGFPLRVKDRIKIKKTGFKTKLLLLHDRDYFRVLRTKLKWGE